MKKRLIIVIGFLVWTFLTVSQNIAAQADAKTEHLIPADKGLSKDFVQRLCHRGQRETYAGLDLKTIGMPVCGVGTGQLYLRGDGTLALWQIFNQHVFSGYGADNYRTYRPDCPVDSGFAVLVRDADRIMPRQLNQDFGTVEFSGEYPIGVVGYRSDDFPAKVEMEVFSPFIPLNAKDSALPATLFHITVENVSAKNIHVGISGWLENAVCMNSAESLDNVLRRSRIVTEKGRNLVVHTAEKAPMPRETVPPRAKILLADFEGPDYGNWKVTGEAFGKAPAAGTLPNQQQVSGFSGKGLVNTYLGGDNPHGTLTSPAFEISRKFIDFLIGGGGQAGQTCINLLIDAKIVRTATGKNNEKLQWQFWNVTEFQGRQAQIEIVDRASGGWGHINIDQIELSDEAQKAPMGPLETLPDYGSMVLMLDKEAPATGAGANRDDVVYPAIQKKSTAISTAIVDLAAGQKRTFIFVLAWFFPNHEHGHQYANRFSSASDVAHYVLDNHARLAGETRKWHKTFYEDSTLPRWLLFRLHSTVCNLATGTCQWWKDGRFWAWEGVGCCEGTCTHVWNYAHAAARLFPELERSAREMQDFGQGFDEKTGLVGFRSNRAYAADGQCGTILKAYREHQMSADSSFLQRNWPRIKKALLFSITQDGNDDGLIENSQHNTYDINFEGPNTFVGSLYLAALRAGEEMAKEMGDQESARRCRKIFESGSQLQADRLWDREYFIQDVDLAKHPKHQYGRGCLSDQLFGQGWAHQLGLGYIYPDMLVETALVSVWEYNWAPDVGPYNAVHKPQRWFARPGEPGLLTCTWPKSQYLTEGVLYREEVWTGIEYQVAGHMIWEGMLTEALAICHGVQQRYQPAKHNPFNEIECGDHYARALASWGVYTALCGYEHHGPKGHLGFAPRITPENFQAAFTAAGAWGSFSQKRQADAQTEQIEVRWGRLNLKTLSFAVPQDFQPVRVSVTAQGKPVQFSYTRKDSRVEVTLKKELVLSEGQVLQIAIRKTG
jgi:uncharacterized protein (DUF608 family)